MSYTCTCVFSVNVTKNLFPVCKYMVDCQLYYMVWIVVKIPLFCTMAGSKSSLHIPTGSPRPLPLVLVGDDAISTTGV